MMEVIEALDTIEQVTEALRQQFDKMRNGYIAVAQAAIAQGYIIRKAEDNGCIAHAGYATKEEYMRETFGLEPDAVSRLISMNKQYSRGGYSEEIDEKYSGFSKTALQEMLGLPAFIIESLDPAMTKMQIREVKNEYKAESEVTQIERALEEQVKTEVALDTPVRQFLYHYFEDEKHAEEYVSVYEAAHSSPVDARKIYLTLAPSGVGVLYVKVPGTGRLMVSIVSLDKLVSITNMWTEEVTQTDFFQMAEEVKNMAAGSTAEESWSKLYGKAFPGTAENNSENDIAENASKTTENENDTTENVSKTTENVNNSGKNVPKSIENVSANAEEYPPAPAKIERPEAAKPQVKEEREEKAADERVEGHIEEHTEEGKTDVHTYVKNRKEQLRNTFNYASSLIQQERWKQLRIQVKAMALMIDDIEKALEGQDVAGQMSLEDMK